MIDVIQASVGRNAKNSETDVHIVQEIMNLYSQDYPVIPELVVDGKSGANTEKAIYAFQKFIVKLRIPDSRMDNAGKTERIFAQKMDVQAVKKVVTKYRPQAQVIPAVKLQQTIHYRPNVRREVSQYSESIIKLAMRFAKISKVDFSSTRRTLSDQARIMYNNCIRYNVSSVTALRAARGWGYGPTGWAVEEVFFANKGKPQMEVRKLMENKISAFLKKGKRTSLHCVDQATYKSLNVIDIPYSSVASNKKKTFQNALFCMTKTIKNATYTNARQYNYINLIIVEDRCWHLEIPQVGKEVPK